MIQRIVPERPLVRGSLNITERDVPRKGGSRAADILLRLDVSSRVPVFVIFRQLTPAALRSDDSRELICHKNNV
ncbi:Hypothetical protein SMAX5B_006035 [Scophthalmus maximus]|uniref:Uncharacterized protein n=1 Tax=Scophthalmus maximus TaxID=52904 RepID=A0A2U9BKN0_SCOMX|nr:Hypothetical protein SMAX5B_006035 [Scophthalmus maximus]